MRVKQRSIVTQFFDIPICFTGHTSMKMISRKLAMPLLGVLLWVISIHAGTFAAATLLPRPLTGTSRTYTTKSPILSVQKRLFFYWVSKNSH